MVAVLLVVLLIVLWACDWWKTKKNTKKCAALREEGKQAYEKKEYAKALECFMGIILIDPWSNKCMDIVNDIESICKESAIERDVKGLKKALGKLQELKRKKFVPDTGGMSIGEQIVGDIHRIAAGKSRKVVIEKEFTQKKTISGINIFFEPRKILQMMMDSGSQVNIPIGHGDLLKAVEQADSFLALGGKLISHFSANPCGIEKIKEMDDTEWGAFINLKSNGREWQRWNAETSQGRWNVVVYK